MGFSFTAKAGDSLRVLEDFCYKQTGATNTFINSRGKKLFFEIDRIDHVDGKITGDLIDFNTCDLIKKFEISNNGKIKNFPKIKGLIIY